MGLDEIPKYSPPAVIDQPSAPPASPAVSKGTVVLKPDRYSHPWLHRILLVATAGFSIATLVPASRHIAGLSLRAIAFVSASAVCADSWEKESVQNRVLNIERIAIVAMGVLGAATATPVFYVAALSAEVGLKTFELMSALMDRDLERSVIHAGMLVIDALVLAAVVTGAWEVMVTAAAVNAFAMFAMGIKKLAFSEDPVDAFDFFCYGALGTVSVVTAIETSKLISQHPDSVHVEYKNENKFGTQGVYDSDKNLVGTVKPGEQLSVDFKYPGKQVTSRLQVIDYKENGYPLHRRYFRPDNVHWKNDIQNPMNPKEYPYLAIGGTSVVDRGLI